VCDSNDGNNHVANFLAFTDQCGGPRKCVLDDPQAENAKVVNATLAACANGMSASLSPTTGQRQEYGSGGLYEPPFTDAAPNGISDVFEGAAITAIVDTLEGVEPRLRAAG
jgi:hypothetical protein